MRFPLIRRAFTLIELLIVVAIIAILAAIAVPNFLEAQTRSKVSRAAADMRTIALGLEAYHVDNNGYPWQNTSSRAFNRPSQGLNPGFKPTLERLTTPVAYITGSGTFRDPFEARATYQGVTCDTVVPIENFNPVDRETFLTYWYMARKFNASNWDDPAIEKPEWWLLSSAGPDGHQHNLGTFFNSVPVGLNRTDAAMGLTQKLVYDPTNGTVSRGSIWRQGGVPTGTGQAFGLALNRNGG